MKRIFRVVLVIVTSVYMSIFGRLQSNLLLGNVLTAVKEEGKPTQPQDQYHSFSQLFGDAAGEAYHTDEKANAIGDQPPPRETWLLDSLSIVPVRTIPRIVNKIYFQKRSGFPKVNDFSANLTEAHKSWPEMNPGYTIRYFDLVSARQYLRRHFHPVFIRAFDCLQGFASKSDLFRMALLYRDGGFHSDWKQRCMEYNLLDRIANATDFFASLAGTWETGSYMDLTSNDGGYPHRCVQNSFVGSVPGHPIVAKMLELSFLNVQKSHYRGQRESLDAGPSVCVFGLAIHESEMERNSTWFSTIAGKEVAGGYEWGGDFIIHHKCDGCGGGQVSSSICANNMINNTSYHMLMELRCFEIYQKNIQDWGDIGNNYQALFKQRKFYCEDAASLFQNP